MRKKLQELMSYTKVAEDNYTAVSAVFKHTAETRHKRLEQLLKEQLRTFNRG